MTVDELHEITRIDRWFLEKLLGLAQFEEKAAGGLDDKGVEQGRALGYTDAALKRISGRDTLPEGHAVYKMVDTCLLYTSRCV